MGKYINIFKSSAAGGAGFMAGTIPQLLVGIFIFIAGFILYKKETKKFENDSSDVKKGFAIVIMLLGSGVGFGLGFGTALNSLSNELK